MASAWQKIAIFGGPVIMILLTGIAGWAMTQQTQLSLPLPLPLTVFTILLPIFTYFNTNWIHRLLFPDIKMTHTMSPGLISPRLGVGIPLIVFQTIYTTVILILSLTYTNTSSTRHCLLERKWDDLFQTRNTAAVRAIQETLECCGFADPHDRPWPFPIERPGDPGYISDTECQSRTPFVHSCEQPWTEAENEAAWKLVAVGGIVLAFQAIYYIFTLYPKSTNAWIETFKAIIGNSSSSSARRRNMRGLIEADANGDSDRVQEVLDRDEEDNNAIRNESRERRGQRRLEGEDEEGNGSRVETSALLDGRREPGGHGTTGNH